MAAAFIERFKYICGSKALVWLLIINTAVFLVLRIAIFIGNAGGLPGNFTMQWLCMSAVPSSFIVHPWTIISYTVTQYDFLHLLFNMLWLFWFGRILQTTLSDRHLITLYIGGGIIGGVFFLLSAFLLLPSSAFLCGASASVLAIMTACAIRTPELRLNLFLFGEVKLKWIAIGCIILTFLGVGGGNTGGQAAHIGGVVFGAAFALLLKRGFDLSRHIFPSAVGKAVREKASSGSRRNVRRDGNAVAKAAAGRLSDSNRLDQLLDKIRFSGYASLSSSERQELNALSKRLNK